MHIFGSTTRSSDLRIMLSFCLNFGIVTAMIALMNNKSLEDGTIFACILAYFSSHNVFFDLGIVKPFKVINEK